MENTTFYVPSISCSVCSNKIHEGLMNLRGIKDVHVDLKTKSVNVEFNSSEIQSQDIRKNIASMGYEVENS